MENTHALTGYILAGGKSSRFGSDKARTFIEGRPVISRIADVMRRFCENVVVVADWPGKYADLNLPTVVDEHPGCGPIGGLETALQAAGEDRWIFLISCDWAILPMDFLRPLLTAPRNRCQAIAYYDDVWQPMPALYHTSLFPMVQGNIQTADLSLWKVLESATNRRLDMPPIHCRGLQFNTWQELKGLQD